MRIFQNLKRMFLFIALLFSGCVEHIVTIVVYPDGNFDYDHYAQGDEDDLLDFDFTLPKGNAWIINTNTNQGETDDLYYHAFRHFNEHEKIPGSFYLGDSLPIESLLNHQIDIEFDNSLFSEVYKFNITFKGRDASEKYPKLAQYALDQENPPEGWAIEALTYIFSQSLIEADIGFNLQPVAEDAINIWFDKIESKYNNDGITTHFDEIMIEGRNVILEILLENEGIEFSKILAKNEQYAKNTLSLSDDVFEYSLIIPGKLYEANADTAFNDTLQWRFGLADFLENDHILMAVSGNYYESRKQWTIISIMVLASVIFIIYMLKTVPDPRIYSK